ncbi:MAG: hypothetical protein WC876_04775 [Candidatus Thermoplasmatota archaeon]
MSIEPTEARHRANDSFALVTALTGMGAVITAALAITDFARAITALVSLALLLVCGGVVVAWRSNASRVHDQKAAGQVTPSSVQPAAPLGKKPSGKSARSLPSRIERVFVIQYNDVKTISFEAFKGVVVSVLVESNNPVSVWIMDSIDFLRFDDTGELHLPLDGAADVLRATLSASIPSRDAYFVVVENGDVTAQVRVVVEFNAN